MTILQKNLENNFLQREKNQKIRIKNRILNKITYFFAPKLGAILRGEYLENK